MVEPAITQPKARTYSVVELVELVGTGKIRVPEFQRPLKWQWEDVRRLFDSIVLGYPIGSLLLWMRPAPAETLTLGARRIEAAEQTEALWVVDGQQRLTSLASALHDAGSKDAKFAIAYDLRERKFVKRSSEGESVLELPVLYDLQRLLKWFAAHPEAAEHLDEATRITTVLRQYQVPAYTVQQDDEAVLRDIFDRMNNYGKRLTCAEVFSALHAGRGALDRPRSFTEIADHLNSRFGFGPVDEDTILRAVLARRGPDVTREIRTEFEGRVSREFGEETPDEAYRGGEAALEHAVSFLQEDAGVPHFAFLPYRYLLVVLARFFAHHPEPSVRNRELLRRWFWRAAIVGPQLARGSYNQAMRTLAAQIVPDDESGSVQALLDKVANRDFGFSLPTQFRTTMAEIRFVLCASWSLGPRSFGDGRPYAREDLAQELAEARTASPALGLVYRPSVKGAPVRVGNRFFLLTGDDLDLARARFDTRPLDLSEETWSALLASHAVAADVLTAAGPDAFWRAREEQLYAVTKRFLERMTEDRLEDTPPLGDLDLDDDEDDVNEGGAADAIA